MKVIRNVNYTVGASTIFSFRIIAAYLLLISKKVILVLLNFGLDMTMIKMMERVNVAMSFNQNKITYQFAGTSVGGENIITALYSSDIGTIGQIKNHIMDIEKEFSEGNFTKPFFIHAQQVPGTKLMSEKKDLIDMRYWKWIMVLA